MFAKLFGHINSILHLSQHLFAFVSCLRELGSLLPVRVSLRGPRSALDNFKYGLSHWISPSNFWKLYKIWKPSFLNQAARLLLDDRQHVPFHQHLARQSSYMGLWPTIVLWARVQLELCSWPSCQEWEPGGPGNLLPVGPGSGIGHTLHGSAVLPQTRDSRQVATSQQLQEHDAPRFCRLGCLRQDGHAIFYLARVEWQLCSPEFHSVKGTAVSLEPQYPHLRLTRSMGGAAPLLPWVGKWRQFFGGGSRTFILFTNAKISALVAAASQFSWLSKYTPVKLQTLDYYFLVRYLQILFIILNPVYTYHSSTFAIYLSVQFSLLDLWCRYSSAVSIM